MNALTMFMPKLATAAGFHRDSRVWVYVTDRPLTDAETQVAQKALNAFVQQWTAHNMALKAAAEVFQNQIVILVVDETQAGASGCSIDKSVHFLEALGKQMGLDFFERMRFGWVSDEGILFGNREEFGAQVRNAHITADTMVVNTLVQNKQDLSEKWLIPFAESWHRRLV